MKNERQVPVMRDHSSTYEKVSKLYSVLKSILLTLLLTISSTSNFVVARSMKLNTDSNANTLLIKNELGDDGKNVKISIPDSKLLKRADKEMNRNMANDMKELKLFKLPLSDYSIGDVQIHTGFHSQYKLVNFYSINPQEDEEVSATFHAYHLENNFKLSFQIADNEINNLFNVVHRIKMSFKDVEADGEMNSNFYSEHL